MPPFPEDPRPLQQWLNQQPSQLRALLAHAQHLAQVGQALREWSDEPWLSQIRLANIRNGTLVLHSSSAAALVRLRQHQRALLDYLNQRFQLRCDQLEAKVRPDIRTLPDRV